MILLATCSFGTTFTTLLKKITRLKNIMMTVRNILEQITIYGGIVRNMIILRNMIIMRNYGEYTGPAHWEQTGPS